MARDPMERRFEVKQKEQTLHDLSLRTRTKEDIEAEKELLKKTPKVEPIKGEEKPDRNAACPCGSGRKYKKCCGAG
jgi:uncharacterized protein YecA (UPF0149 family)